MRVSLLVVAAGVLLGPAQVAPCATPVDYTNQIEPILRANCFGCHGEDKGLGRVRLHNTEAIKTSLDAHDDLLVAGKADESELYERLVLPADNKKRMPKGADPLPEEQIALIKKWIEEGATFEVTADAPAAKAMNEQPAAQKPELPERPELEPASPEAIAAVEATGAVVIPLYAGANELRVSFPSSRDEVTDETVAAMVPLAGQLVELDISGTNITDASAESLRKLVNLDTLHLEKTAVTDATVAALVEMQYLKYLNLHSTKVTDAGLESLKPVMSLEKLYVWQTAASYDAAKALEQAIPELEVNLGWDHPGVVRERLTTELQRVEQQQSESAAAVTAAAQALATAKAEQKAADDRAAEIKQELEGLDKPAADESVPADEGAQPAEQPANEGDSA